MHFFQKNLHISKIFRTFAADLENKQKSNQVFNILTIRIYSQITTKTMPNKDVQTIFRQIGGVWQSVSTEKPQLFCEWLAQNQIQFDDACVFARYEQYEGKHDEIKTTIEIRQYGGTIQTNVRTTII